MVHGPGEVSLWPEVEVNEPLLQLNRANATLVVYVASVPFFIALDQSWNPLFVNEGISNPRAALLLGFKELPVLQVQDISFFHEGLVIVFTRECVKSDSLSLR